MIIEYRDLPLKKKKHVFLMFFLCFSAFLTIKLVLNYFKLVNFGLKHCISLSYDERNCWIPLDCPNLVSKHTQIFIKNVFFGMYQPFLPYNSL